MKYPVYQLSVEDLEDEEFGVNIISFVSDPAIKVNYLALASQEPEIKLAVDKQILYGPLLTPDSKIYRKVGDNEFYITFTAEAIEKIREKYFKLGNTFNFNIEHAEDTEGHHIVESWLIDDKEIDKAAKLGFNLPVGTWMAGVKINDPDLWNNRIKTGELNGFSIEGNFNYKLKDKLKNHDMSNEFNVLMSMHKELMGSIKKLFISEKGQGKELKGVYNMPVKTPMALQLSGQAVTSPTLNVLIDNQGQALVVNPNNYQTEPLPAGSYYLGQNRNLVIQDGACALELSAELKLSSFVFEAGKILQVDDETGEAWFLLPDGEVEMPTDGIHVAEDGTSFTIEGGMVKEVMGATKPEEEVKAEGEQKMSNQNTQHSEDMKALRTELSELKSFMTQMQNEHLNSMREIVGAIQGVKMASENATKLQAEKIEGINDILSNTSLQHFANTRYQNPGVPSQAQMDKESQFAGVKETALSALNGYKNGKGK